MPEEKEPPRPHGDKLHGRVGGPNATIREENQAQVQSDAQHAAMQSNRVGGDPTGQRPRLNGEWRAGVR